jgi:hypothetical protein
MGGTGYAAVRLPAASVGAKHLKKNSVSSAKVKNRSLLLDDFKRAARTKLRGANGAQGTRGLVGLRGLSGLRGGQGTAGIEGVDGTAGIDGTPGADGATGVEQVLVRTTALSFIAGLGPNGQVLSDDVQCQLGESVVGGGADIDPSTPFEDQPNVIVASSRPAASDATSPAEETEPRGWFVTARRNTNAGNHTVTVYVLCASAAP